MMTYFLIVLVTFLVLEVISRLILIRVYNRKFDSDLIVENLYGTSSGLKANEVSRIWGKAFHTDRRGFREHANDKRMLPKKLFVIGDSVTEGVGVQDNQTFANLICNAEDSVDVMNISLIGYSTPDYLNVAKSFLSDTTKDSIGNRMYVFLCLNDIYGKSKTSDLPPMANKGFLSSINALLQDNYATYKIIKLLIYQNSGRYFDYDQAFYKDENRVEEMVNNLVQIKSVCDKAKVALKVFILPYRSQLLDPKKNFPQQTLAYHLGMNGIPFQDLLFDLKNTEKPKDLYLFADEIHFSDKGHEAIAHAVLKK